MRTAFGWGVRIKFCPASGRREEPFIAGLGWFADTTPRPAAMGGYVWALFANRREARKEAARVRAINMQGTGRYQARPVRLRCLLQPTTQRGA